jgi:pimeloyl-ACP methyl ester carboxylesterase
MTESLWRTTFMQDGTADELDLAVRRLLPTPFGWFDEKIHLPRFFDLDLPSSYIFPRQDIAIPREQAEQMAARLADPRLVACEGGHQAMQSRPRHLTDALIAASEEKN